MFCIAAQSFPTPMEEPKKILRAHYLGCTQVCNATGMDTLNDSIEKLVTSTSQDQWQSVNISIAPSMITIHHPNVSSFLWVQHTQYFKNNSVFLEFLNFLIEFDI